MLGIVRLNKNKEDIMELSNRNKQTSNVEQTLLPVSTKTLTPIPTTPHKPQSLDKFIQLTPP